MAAGDFNKFTCFATDVGLEKHNLNTDTIKAALTDHLPDAGDTVFSDAHFVPPTEAHGYTALGHDTTNLFAAGKMTCTNIVITAAGGTIGPFRYVVLYNDDAASDELIGWYDYGSSITLALGETFTITFDAGAGVLTIT
jgi:hypothetical protein